MTNTTLEWNNVNYSIRQGFLMKPHKVIKDLNLKIPEGFSLGLVGSNGAGKTTTIKLAAGILKPDTGSVTINGKHVFGTDTRSCVGFLTESQYLYPHLKLKEWLKMLGYLSGMTTSDLTSRIDYLVDKFELSHKANSLLSAMSKGEMQRAGFVQAFLHNPKILMLDEPMSGLDPLWRGNIQDILLDFKKSGGTLLFSSHIMSDVERLSDTIAVIVGGTIRWQGNMGDLPVSETGSGKQYQAIFHIENMENGSRLKLDALQSTLKGCNIERQPDGSFFVKLDHDSKQKLIEVAGQGGISIDSLTSVYPNFKEMFK
ncbi:MAG: ABC transporter ATP-binding protein [Desulfamplus sp.]|nr:ABC transporter ATP-binding protein [Desulfamplus sp.]